MVKYDRASGYVTFHENGREYLWHIPSAKVYNVQGRLISENCHNLAKAREAVTKK